MDGSSWCTGPPTAPCWSCGFHSSFRCIAIIPQAPLGPDMASSGGLPTQHPCQGWWPKAFALQVSNWSWSRMSQSTLQPIPNHQIYMLRVSQQSWPILASNAGILVSIFLMVQLLDPLQGATPVICVSTSWIVSRLVLLPGNPKPSRLNHFQCPI